MRRFLIRCLLLSSLLFASCSNFTANDCTITNNSSKAVTFSLPAYGNEVYSLQSGASMDKELYSYSSCVIESPKNAVIFKSEKYGITFSDRISGVYICVITNNNSSDVTVSEKYGRVGDNGDSFVVEKEKSLTVIVYTKSPVFTAVDSEGNFLPINFTVVQF